MPANNDAMTVEAAKIIDKLADDPTTAVKMLRDDLSSSAAPQDKLNLLRLINETQTDDNAGKLVIGDTTGCGAAATKNVTVEYSLNGTLMSDPVYAMHVRDNSCAPGTAPPQDVNNPPPAGPADQPAPQQYADQPAPAPYSDQPTSPPYYQTAPQDGGYIPPVADGSYQTYAFDQSGMGDPCYIDGGYVLGPGIGIGVGLALGVGLGWGPRSWVNNENYLSYQYRQQLQNSQYQQQYGSSFYGSPAQTNIHNTNTTNTTNIRNIYNTTTNTQINNTVNNTYNISNKPSQTGGTQPWQTPPHQGEGGTTRQPGQGQGQQGGWPRQGDGQQHQRQPGDGQPTQGTRPSAPPVWSHPQPGEGSGQHQSQPGDGTLPNQGQHQRQPGDGTQPNQGTRPAAPPWSHPQQGDGTGQATKPPTTGDGTGQHRQTQPNESTIPGRAPASPAWDRRGEHNSNPEAAPTPQQQRQRAPQPIEPAPVQRQAPPQQIERQFPVQRPQPMPQQQFHPQQAAPIRQAPVAQPGRRH